jgi:hypothetical protein
MPQEITASPIRDEVMNRIRIWRRP